METHQQKRTSVDGCLSRLEIESCDEKHDVEG